MKKPDIPIHEHARLQTLYALNILDTEAEERFDRLTRMAKRLFDVPIALVSLVDENRQWFKSCFGLPVLETSRDISFCGHAILGDKTFVIEDASKDERFADNPLVTGAPNIRFYAGYPLSGIDGHKLGTLCIIDDKARRFTKADIEALEDLAILAEKELSAVQLATLDELTGISNRRGFRQISEFFLNVSKRQELELSLIYLDLDDFKSINDTFGHAEGDKVLKCFVTLLEDELRESDLFARFGGDEFVILMANTPPEKAEVIVERFKQALAVYNQTIVAGYQIAFSHGIVSFDNAKHKSMSDLLDDGDAKMYKIKQAQNNKTKV